MRRKRTKAQRDLDRAEMVRLLRRGWSRLRIAEHMGLSEGTISSEWRIILKQVVKNRDVEVAEKVALLLEEYDEVKREAWEAWEESKKERKKVVVEEFAMLSKRPGSSEEDEDEGNPTGSGFGRKSVRTTTTKEKRLPGNEYLKTILACLDSMAELQGLIPEKRVAVVGSVDWDAFIKEVGDEPPDVIEAKLLALTQEAAAANQAKEVDVEGLKVHQSVNGHGKLGGDLPKTEENG